MLHWQPAPTPITPQSNRHAAVLNSAISREWDQELRRADPQHGRNGKATKVEDVGVLFIVLVMTSDKFWAGCHFHVVHQAQLVTAKAKRVQ